MLADSKLDPLSSIKFCVLINVNKIFERNSSLEYYNTTCIGKTKHTTTNLMSENSLKMASSNHRSRCTVALGTSTCCKLIFLPSRMKCLLQHAV